MCPWPALRVLRLLREHPALVYAWIFVRHELRHLAEGDHVQRGVLDLGFVTLATENRNSDNVVDGTTPLSKRLVFTGGAPARPVSRPARRVRV